MSSPKAAGSAARCALCLSTGAETVFLARDYRYDSGRTAWPIVRCTSCGLVRLGLRTAVAYEEAYPQAFRDHRLAGVEDEAEGPKVRRSIRAARRRDRARRVFWQRAARLGTGDGGRVLDIGCGAGDFLMALDPSRWSRTGTDYSAETCMRAHAVTRLPLASADAARLPFSGCTFDAVTAWGSIEHLAEPVLALAEAHRVLRPGGRLILFVPNALGPMFRVFGLVDPPRHLYHFTERTLRLALGRAGFAPDGVTFWPAAGENLTGLVHAFKGFARQFSDQAKVEADRDRAVLAFWLMTLHRLVKLVGYAMHPLDGILAALGLGDALVVEARRSRSEQTC